MTSFNIGAAESVHGHQRLWSHANAARGYRLLMWSWLLALPLAGCSGLGYVASAVFGELDLLSRQVSLAEALGDPDLTEEQREKLSLVIQARDYAQHVMGLEVGRAYQTYVNLHDKPLAWNLSASRIDAFEPYLWNIPFVGPLPYIGYFDKDQAMQERDRLVAENYDTVVYELDAYSTLGLLPDPITSAMLERNLISLVDTVIHENLHNTIYSMKDSSFDESLATFVGRTGAIEFLQAQFGVDAAIVQDARNWYEDNDRFNVFLQDLMAELQIVYGSDLSLEEKIKQRQVIYAACNDKFAAEVLPQLHAQDDYQAYTSMRFNNAFLLLNVRYNTAQDVFEAVYDLAGRDWSQALPIFAEAARSDDPGGYLRALVGAPAN